MKICAAIVMGFLLDLWLADPAWMPHPVVIMGKCITGLEKFLRARFPATPEGERAAGRVLAVVLPVGTLLLTAAVCLVANRLHPLLGLAVQTIWCWQALAVKGLAVESRRVYGCLAAEDLPGARKAVARIVGRDTQNLSEEGVAKAAVETVAENSSDGVIAPLLFLALGGPALGFFYKAVNTLDSMVGYKNDTYLYFGRFSAKLDDVLNFIPSRISGLLLVLASPLAGLSMEGAWKIFRRDRRNHASPNSAQTEAAAAGALGVQLAGDAYYFGKLYKKPTIGDPLRPVEYEDIRRVNRLMYAAVCLALVLAVLASAAVNLSFLIWVLRFPAPFV